MLTNTKTWGLSVDRTIQKFENLHLAVAALQNQKNRNTTPSFL